MSDKKVRVPTVRLTNKHREEILKRLVDDALAADAAAAAVLAREAAEVAYAQLIGEHADLIASLPKGWLVEEGSVDVRFQGNYMSLPLGQAVRFPANAETIPVIDSKSKLFKLLEQLTTARSKLGRRREDLKAEVRGILWAHTTAASLGEAWPEVKPLIEEIVGERQVMPLARPGALKALNKKLGLAPGSGSAPAAEQGGGSTKAS